MRSPCLATVFVVLVACSQGAEDGEPTSKPSSKPSAAPQTTSATPPASASVKIDTGDKKPGIEARVKAEVDNRADGITGTVVSPSGARATIQRPKDWTEGKGDFTTATSADKKA